MRSNKGLTSTRRQEWLNGIAALSVIVATGCSPKASEPTAGPSATAAAASPVVQAPAAVVADGHPPNCSDPQVTKIIADNLLAEARSPTRGEPAPRQASYDRYFKEVKLYIDQVTTDGYDQNARRRSCQGRLSFGDVGDSGGEVRAPIVYIVQMTEGSAGEFIVRTSDHPPIEANVVGGYASRFADKVQSGEIKLDQPAGIASPSSDWHRQCVAPKSSVTPEKLVVQGTGIYDSPSAAAPANVLKLNLSLWAVEKRGAWLRLTGASDSTPYADGAPVGWVKESEIDRQNLRNCN